MEFEENQHALESWGNYLERLVGRTPGNIASGRAGDRTPAKA
jgi:hypothetical protein